MDREEKTAFGKTEEIGERAAEALLSIRAVFLRPEEPFTWASGIRSPIYCDNRLVLSFPSVRTLIEEGIAETVKREYPEAEALFGTATAGIAHAAIAAQFLGLPMGYVRGKAKDHGRKNRIEGRLSKGEKVVVIEDLISTGGSVLDCVEALREEGAEVLGIVSIFTYGMKKGLERLDSAKVRNKSLCDLDTLLKVALRKGYIRPEDEGKLLRFRDDPADESWMR
ncbi:MAG: orotate phosphoribosyltransferase [Oribacterium sp.]